MHLLEHLGAERRLRDWGGQQSSLAHAGRPPQRPEPTGEVVPPQLPRRQKHGGSAAVCSPLPLLQRQAPPRGDHVLRKSEKVTAPDLDRQVQGRLDHGDA